MTTDWHAAYLTCPTTAAAAARRCATTGEDGWAAAATLARTMPPGFGYHEAAGARAVIAPVSEPSEEEARLAFSASVALPPWASTQADPQSLEEWERRRDESSTEVREARQRRLIDEPSSRRLTRGRVRQAQLTELGRIWLLRRRGEDSL